MYFLLNKNLFKSPVSLFHLLNIKFNVSGFILSESVRVMFEPVSRVRVKIRDLLNTVQLPFTIFVLPCHWNFEDMWPMLFLA